MTASVYTGQTNRVAKVSYWISDPHARDYVVRLSTSFYALLILIVGVVLELANLIVYGTEHIANVKDLLFSLYMYGSSCAVIGYCARNVLVDHNHLKRIRRTIAKIARVEEPDPEMLSNSSTGSMYLRIGCVVFGLISVIYHSLHGLVCIFGWDTVSECNAYGVINSSAATAFVFFQMWFVYCNGKIAINGSARHFICLGLMHLVATNLWQWIRFVLYEEAETMQEIQLAHHINATAMAVLAEGHHTAVCHGIQCVFGQFSELMHTCVVEYSLICAGVAFVFWTNCASHHHDGHGMRMRKRNIITIDCSRTAEGLFIGFVFLICAVLTVILLTAYSGSAKRAQVIFLSTMIILYVITILCCGYAFWKMRVLAFTAEQEEEDQSAEFLDQILLVVGLIGELVFCLGGALAFVNHRDVDILSSLLLIVNILRLIQVALQSALLLIGARLTLDNENPMTLRHKPGKQVITVLLIVNLALFFMSIFEAQKAGATDEIVQMYGSRAWALIVRGCSPLTVFYRFHSSVCFAEIWKKSFKVARARARSV